MHGGVAAIDLENGSSCGPTHRARWTKSTWYFISSQDYRSPRKVKIEVKPPKFAVNLYDFETL
jgi:hypothetical protein